MKISDYKPDGSIVKTNDEQPACAPPVTTKYKPFSFDEIVTAMRGMFDKDPEKP